MSDKNIFEMEDLEMNEDTVDETEMNSEEVDMASERDDMSDELALDLDDIGGMDDAEFQPMVEQIDDNFDEFMTAETSGFASGFPEWDLLPPER